HQIPNSIRIELRAQNTQVIAGFAGYFDTDMAAHVISPRHPQRKSSSERCWRSNKVSNRSWETSARFPWILLSRTIQKNSTEFLNSVGRSAVCKQADCVLGWRLLPTLQQFPFTRYATVHLFLIVEMGGKGNSS